MIYFDTNAWIAGIGSTVLELAFSPLWELGETCPKPLRCECMARHATFMACEIYTSWFFLCECHVVSTACIYVPWMVSYLQLNIQQNDQAFWKSLKDHTSWWLMLRMTMSCHVTKVTERFVPQTQDKSAQTTDCENLKLLFPVFFQDQESKKRPDALNASRAHGTAGNGVQIWPPHKDL